MVVNCSGQDEYADGMVEHDMHVGQLLDVLDRPLRADHALSGAAGGYLYVGDVPAGRPPGDYTPRVVPAHREAIIPLEARFIRWYPS